MTVPILSHLLLSLSVCVARWPSNALLAPSGGAASAPTAETGGSSGTMCGGGLVARRGPDPPELGCDSLEACVVADPDSTGPEKYNYNGHKRSY